MRMRLVIRLQFFSENDFIDATTLVGYRTEEVMQKSFLSERESVTVNKIIDILSVHVSCVSQRLHSAALSKVNCVKLLVIHWGLTDQRHRDEPKNKR